jgi:hypothetical protein
MSNETKKDKRELTGEEKKRRKKIQKKRYRIKKYE